MKKLFTLFSLLPLALQAQITLNQSDYSSWMAGTDNLKLVSSGIPALVTGANQGWDMTNMVYGGSASVTRMNGTNAVFPSATYKTEITYSFGGSFMINGIAWGANSSNGIETYGEEITNRQAFSLAAITIGPNDSLVFPVQVVDYSSPRTMLKLPAHYGDNWISDYRYETDFVLTIALASYNNAPGKRVTYATQTDSISGWGKMKVKTNSGSASGWMDVLQVKTATQFIDSFYANGAAIDNSLLNAAGLGQGMETYGYSVSYYRVGEVTPLMETSYSDPGYDTAQTAYVHTDRLSPASVSDVFRANVSLYPNPVSDRTIFLNIDRPAGEWTYEICNAVGQKIATAPLHIDGNKAEITLDDAQPTGMYYLRIYQGGVAVDAKPFVIR